MSNLLLKLATVAALATPVLLAQAPAATPPPVAGTQPSNRLGEDLRPGRILRALNLSDSQRQQARSIFQQARRTAQPVRQQLLQNRQMLRDAVKSGTNGAPIQQLATQQGSLLGQMVAIRSEAWAQFLNGLTPDQRAQASQMMP